MINKNKIDVNPLNAIPAILMMIVVFVALFYLATGVFTILKWATPVLLLITAVINHNVIVSYGKMIIKLFKTNPIMGLVATVLTFLMYPIVCLFLFGKALFLRKVDNFKKDMETRQKGEYAEFEEIEDIRPEQPLRPEIMELPPLPKKQPQARNNNDYEDLFEQ